ncbi:MAG: hypothetical protein JOZ96_22450 [Acidobacteria bacterium]|nr:hypothetical protein [Acidobacteriota bacterium]
MRVLTAFALTLCCACVALAQTPSSNTATQLSTKVVGTVNENVSAQAVLIPRVDARRLFGKEIAENYAVVEINIGNKSPDAALIIHGIFIDYSNWPLSGMSRNDVRSLDMPDGRFANFQTGTRPSQVASEEYRVVRGQLLDAQAWTRRNLAIRLLNLAGSLATAYTFSLNEQGIIKGINAATGVGIPGIATAWPDSTIDQLNRVSDFGFRANRVVSKQGAEVVVCFFPIDRFLTPGFRKLFLKSPALFFAPLQMLVDRQSQSLVTAALGEDLGIKPSDLGLTEAKEIIPALRAKLPCFLKIVREAEPGADTGTPSLLSQISRQSSEICLKEFGMQVGLNGDGVRTLSIQDEAKFKAFAALFYIKEVSLNKVTVTVDGVLSVEVSAIEPRVESVTFDEVAGCGGPNTECFWSSSIGGGVRTGKVTGNFLSGGTLDIPGAEDFIGDLKVVPEGSSDNVLRFSLKLKKGVPTGRTLNFKVNKPKPGSTGKLESPAFMLQTAFFPGTPTLAGVGLKDGKVTVTGAGFVDAPAPNALSVKLMAPNKTVQTIQNPTVANDKITFDMPAGPAAGCWRVMVQAGARDAIELNDGRFAVLPSPTVSKATIDGDKIVVDGTNFMDTANCPGGKAVRFRAVKAGEKAVDLIPKSSLELNKGEFKLPDGVDTNWLVEVLVGDAPVGDKSKKGQIELTKK